MFRAVASELSISFEGPIYGLPDGEARELAALAGPRGFLDLRRISLTAHNALRMDTIFKASSDYLKPFPHPELEELLGDGTCNVLLSDGYWVNEHIAIVERPDSPDGYVLISVDADQRIDTEWIDSKVDVLIGRRLPGLTGLWHCASGAPVSSLSVDSENGVEALKIALGRAIHEVEVDDAGRSVALADVLSVPIARRRQLVSNVFAQCVTLVERYLDYWVRFDLCEIDPNGRTAILDAQTKPVGHPMLRVRYQLTLRESSSSPQGNPPRVVDATSAEHLVIAASFVPPGFLGLETFTKREAARDIVALGWSLPLLGRENEVRDILSLLQEVNFRLVPIVAAGGIGKTRFLIEVGKRALGEGLVESVYCASPSLELHRDWHKDLPRSQRCLLIIDDPANASIVRWIADELSEPECRWTALVSVRSGDGATTNALVMESRNKFVAPIRSLAALSRDDATSLATKALESDGGTADQSAVSWIVRMSQGVPVWLLLAARIILDGADPRELPRDKWRLAERYVGEAIPTGSEERDLQLLVLRWLALLHPFNREALALVKYLCDQASITSEKFDSVVETLRRKNLVAVYGVDRRMVEVRPAIVRDYLVTSWMSHEGLDGAISASPAGRALIDQLAAEHSSVDRAVLQRILAALGRVTEILAEPLPVLEVLGAAVERAATAAADAEQQLDTLALASLAAPATLRSFLQVARTLRITNVPDHVRTEPWGKVVRHRSEVLRSLPWVLFTACQFARTRAECQLVVEELLALAGADVPSDSERVRNDGKSASDLIPRLVSERLSPEFRNVLVEKARGYVTALQGANLVPRLPAVAAISPLIAVVAEYNWTDADQFVWGHYVIDPASSRGEEIAALAAQIVIGLRRPKLEENSVLLWELFEKFHDGLMRATMEGSSSWETQLLDCLRACHEILTARDLSGREWFRARKLWHWHERYDKDPERQNVARSCEQLFTTRPEFATYFQLLFGEREPNETERARNELVGRLLDDTSADVGAFLESALRFVAESGEQWRARRVEALAERLGESMELAPHVRAFLTEVGNERTPLVEAAISILRAHLGAIRRSGDTVLLRASLDKWASVFSPTLLIEDVYLNADVLTQAHLSSADWEFATANLSLFSGALRWRLLGLAFATNAGRTREFVENEVGVVRPDVLHEMLVWFWAGFHSRFIVEEYAKRPAMTYEEFEWFLSLLARVPDLNMLSGAFADDIETLGARHPKHPARWACRLVQKRRERGTAECDGVWAISHDRLFLSFTEPAHADDSPAIDALLTFASRQKPLVYGLPEFVATLDPEGLILPTLVVARLRSVGEGSDRLDELATWSEYASSYAVDSVGWRLIAEVACELVGPLSPPDRARVYWQLFHQRSGVWSGRVGEVSSKWTSAVTEAEALLQREGDGPLQDLFAWHLEQARGDLRREEGRAQEESVQFSGRE